MNSIEAFSTDIKEKTLHGSGVCAGIPYGKVRVKTIKITDDPIASIEKAEETPIGGLGEVLLLSL